MLRRVTFEIESDYSQVDIEEWALKLIKSVAIDPTKCRIIGVDSIRNPEGIEENATKDDYA